MLSKNDDRHEKDKQIYMNGIRKFMSKGVPVFINGEKADEDELDRLFTPPDGTFYMADFVIEEMAEAKAEAEPLVVREAEEESFYFPPKAQKRFNLKEIRFDPAYHA